ncbi:MAG: preprotein translocase subunit YajC [Bacteroidota bacterium]|nr:preprotein translocase subunit YajC [Bacteroidota bacterium]
MLNILLQASTTNNISNILFIGAIVLVFYFFMIRPQQKKVSDAKKFRESLTKGMNVVTIGGLHGKLVEINDTTVWIEVEKGLRLKFDKSAIAVESTTKANEKA